MWVTIYTDASFKDGRGAGAYWIKSNLKRIVIKEALDAKDSNVAEIEIAYKAIKECIKQHPTNSITGILIVSDNMTVVNCFKYQAKTTKNITISKYQIDLVEILAYHKIKIRTKHIKGHGSNSTRPGWLNNTVDKIAKI